MTADWVPLQFIGEPIEVTHDRPPVLEKKPDSPSSFRWRGETHRVAAVLSRWFDFRRRGDMARNMRQAHLEHAARRGSWGVGRFYFRVQTEGRRVFDLYYDRSPTSAGDRKGHWFLWRELGEA